MQQITSLDNKLIKYASALHDKKYRDKNGEFLAEGFRLIADLLKNDFSAVKSIFISQKQADKFFKSAVSAGATESSLSEKMFVVSDALIKKLCDTQSPQEVVAVVAQKKEFDIDCLDFWAEKAARFIYLDRIRDPGNLGTILRTAAAAGYRVVLDNCADIYSPKVIRAGMGAALLAECVCADVDTLDKLKEKGCFVLAADMEGSNMYQFEPLFKLCIVIGGEADGISAEILKKCDKIISIPMQKTESLNAAVAAGILMYQYLVPIKN